MAKAKKPASRKSPSADVQSVLDPLSAAMKSAFLRQSAGQAAVHKTKEPPKKKRVRPAVGKKEAGLDDGTQVSPLAPAHFPKLPAIAGVELGCAKTGSKYKGRTDFLAVRLAPHTSVAGVFTQSMTAAAPVEWCRQALAAGGVQAEARLLLVNAGNANAFTGRAGMDAVKTLASKASTSEGCRQRDIFICSTGVIGEPLDTKPLIKGFGQALKSATPEAWENAARAIMTTDTYPKGVTRTALIDGVPVTINGISKGSGMIEPDMATMLAYVFTDAALPAAVLQTLLVLGVRESFNAITVDSDTSTSDSVLLFATGQQTEQCKITRAGDRRLADFRNKLQEVLTELAHLIVKDGEGATKFVTVNVTGAATPKSAKIIARSIANSPLVKTALAGEDANWGRVVMAVGKAGEPADRDRLAIQFGPHRVAHKGARDPNYSEAAVSRYMKQAEIELSVDVGIGKGQARIWTCDLTHGYISINADYRS